jgi:hypothetical protein
MRSAGEVSRPKLLSRLRALASSVMVGAEPSRSLCRRLGRTASRGVLAVSGCFRSRGVFRCARALRHPVRQNPECEIIVARRPTTGLRIALTVPSILEWHSNWPPHSQGSWVGRTSNQRLHLQPWQAAFSSARHDGTRRTGQRIGAGTIAFMPSPFSPKRLAASAAVRCRQSLRRAACSSPSRWLGRHRRFGDSLLMLESRSTNLGKLRNSHGPLIINSHVKAIVAPSHWTERGAVDESHNHS